MKVKFKSSGKPIDLNLEAEEAACWWSLDETKDFGQGQKVKKNFWFEFKSMVEEKVRVFGANPDKHYKYWIYLQLNPNLKPSPFLNRIDKIGKAITKFRLGSHLLKIETGRWNRTPRESRLCDICGVVEDEVHVIYSCTKVHRSDLHLPHPLSAIWDHECVNQLFKRLIDEEYIT